MLVMTLSNSYPKLFSVSYVSNVYFFPSESYVCVFWVGKDKFLHSYVTMVMFMHSPSFLEGILGPEQAINLYKCSIRDQSPGPM